MISRRAMARNFVENLGKQATGELARALAAELVTTHRAGQMDLVMNDISEQLFELRGDLFGTVTSAHKLSEALHKELEKTIQKLSGAKSVALSQETDANLIGGVIIDTPVEQYDWSVRTKLEKLEA